MFLQKYLVAEIGACEGKWRCLQHKHTNIHHDEMMWNSFWWNYACASLPASEVHLFCREITAQLRERWCAWTEFMEKTKAGDLVSEISCRPGEETGLLLLTDQTVISLKLVLDSSMNVTCIDRIKIQVFSTSKCYWLTFTQPLHSKTSCADFWCAIKKKNELQLIQF